MTYDLVRRLDQAQVMTSMAWLPSARLLARISLVHQLSPWPIAGWRFTAVVAVLGRSPFQFVNPRHSPRQLLLKVSHLRLELRNPFLRFHAPDSISSHNPS